MTGVQTCALPICFPVTIWAAVEKGQPLFKEAEAQYRIESDKNIIEAIKDFDGSPRATVALTHEIMHPTVVSIIDGVKEGNEVGAKHTKTIIDEYNKATGKNITQEQLIDGNDKFKEGTTTKEYRAVQEFIAIGQASNQSLTNIILAKSLSEISPDFDINKLKDLYNRGKVDKDGYFYFNGVKYQYIPHLNQVIKA